MDIVKKIFAPFLAAIISFAFLLPHSTFGYAQEPPSVPSGKYFHDSVGVSKNPDEIIDKLNRLSRSGTAMHIVITDSFVNPSAPQKWAANFRKINNIHSQDLTLAIAAAGKYQIDIPRSSGLSVEQQKSLNETVKSSLTGAKDTEDWTAALVDIVDETQAAIDRRPSDVSTQKARKSTESFWQTLPFFVLPFGLLAIGVWWYLSKRRKRYSAAPDARKQRPYPSEDPFQGTSYDALDAQSSKLLVAADDAIKSSAQEVSFAEAQFGAEAVESFQKSLRGAQEKLREAFHYRQLLDDEEPDTAQEQKSYFDGIIRLCTEINDKLNADKAAFDKLRALEANAADALKKVEANALNARERLPAGIQTLSLMRQEYCGPAVKAVRDNPLEAEERLFFADKAIQTAAEMISSPGEKAKATLAIKAAEEATDQAASLLHAISEAKENLDQARKTMEQAISDAAVAAAEAHAVCKTASRPDLAGAVAGLEETVNQAQKEICSPPVDPEVIANRIERSRTKVDELLQGAYLGTAKKDKRISESFEHVISCARSSIRSAEHYIQDRRGAINVEARTRISEARRSLDHALSLRKSNMEQALEQARQARRYAQDASDLAQQNINDYRGNATFGGNPGIGLGGAILGGILIDSMFNHRHGNGYQAGNGYDNSDNYDGFGGDLFGGGYGGFTDGAGDFFGSDSF